MTSTPSQIPTTPVLRYAEEPDISPGYPALRRTSEPASGMWQRIGIHLGVWAFLFAIAWLAHFSQSRNIGFYSDDQTFAVRPLSWSPADFSLWIGTKVISYPEPQGRPLGFMLGILFAYAGDRLAGMNGMFIVGWWILSINAILFYHLLRRSFSEPIPLLGAIGFLLFPADTTRPFLCHEHILQPSLMFMLIAAHLYLGGGRSRRVLAYAVATLCLITYESALLPFIAIPLLERQRDKRGLAKHVAIVVLIIVFIGLTRKLGHEYRTEAASTSKATVLLEILAGSVIGPAAALWTFVLRTYTAAGHLWAVPTDGRTFVAAIGAFALILQLCRKGLSANTAGDVRRATAFGAAALGVSYLFSFTHFPPACLEGQTTSVHLAAVVGASTLFAALITAVIARSRTQVVAISIIGIYLGLLFVSALAEQDGYVTLWRERQAFWTRLLDVCPDVQDQTLIVCDNQLPQPNHLMPVNCWSDSVVLEQVYQMPENFVQNPQVSCFRTDDSGHGWRTWLARDSAGRVVWIKSPYGRKIGAELVEGNTILLHMDSAGSITRVGGTVDIGGKPFRLRDPVPRRKLPFATLRFYEILAGAAR